MAKITRKNQKIFGINSGLNQIGEFGSRFNGTPSYTTDPESIQDLSNYLIGWYAAVLGNNSPAMQDLNAICYLYAYQLAYIFQAGIPEWNTSTTYYTGSYVQKNGIVYRSLIDDNVSFDPETSANWVSPLVPGVTTSDEINRDLTVVSGQTLILGTPTVNVSKTVTVNSGGNLAIVNSLTVNGTVIVNGNLKVA